MGVRILNVALAVLAHAGNDRNGGLHRKCNITTYIMANMQFCFAFCCFISHLLFDIHGNITIFSTYHQIDGN
jgi:hypothetical protein